MLRSRSANSSMIIKQYLSSPSFNHQFQYRYVVGKLNFFENITQVDIYYASHQVDRFCKDPHFIHGTAIEHLTEYLCGTCNNGLILDPNYANSFKVYDETDFCGNWYRPTMSDKPVTTKLRSG